MQGTSPREAARHTGVRRYPFGVGRGPVRDVTRRDPDFRRDDDDCLRRKFLLSQKLGPALRRDDERKRKER